MEMAKQHMFPEILNGYIETVTSFKEKKQKKNLSRRTNEKPNQCPNQLEGNLCAWTRKTVPRHKYDVKVGCVVVAEDDADRIVIRVTEPHRILVISPRFFGGMGDVVVVGIRAVSVGVHREGAAPLAALAVAAIVTF